MLFSTIKSIYEFRHSIDIGVASTMQPENHCSFGKRTFLSWFQLSFPCSSFNFSPLQEKQQNKHKTPHPTTKPQRSFRSLTKAWKYFFPVKSLATVRTVSNSSFKRSSDEVCLCSGTEFYSDKTADTLWCTSFNSNDSRLLKSS